MLVDTSGLFAYLSDEDKSHVLARQLLDNARRRVIHSSVLTEFVALADSRGESRTRALDFTDSILDGKDFEVVWLDEEDHRQAITLLKARLDKRYSLCDAASFILMRRMNLTQALTTDHHFEQEGFTRLLR